MRIKRATLLCDGDDGECGAWVIDHYTETASMVNDVRITRDHRAPGWTSTSFDDWCPEHKPSEVA